jgi:hypothetical protein
MSIVVDKAEAVLARMEQRSRDGAPHGDLETITNYLASPFVEETLSSFGPAVASGYAYLLGLVKDRLAQIDMERSA